MSEAQGAPRHDPLVAVRQPNFAVYMFSRLLYGVGQAVLEAAMAWQVYAISGSALDLGLIGLIRFAPALVFSVIGGAVSDTYNRRLGVILADTVTVAFGGALAGPRFHGSPS